MNNVATELMDLPLEFSWFIGPTERRGAVALVGLEGFSPASIYEGKWGNASGATP